MAASMRYLPNAPVNRRANSRLLVIKTCLLRLFMVPWHILAAEVVTKYLRQLLLSGCQLPTHLVLASTASPLRQMPYFK